MDIEGLKNELRNFDPVYRDDDVKLMTTAANAIEQLQRELEEARKDAHKCLIGERRHGGVEWVNQQPNGWPIGTRFYAAIDAAREKP